MGTEGATSIFIFPAPLEILQGVHSSLAKIQLVLHRLWLEDTLVALGQLRDP